jgi:hypothetical protein
MFNSPGERRRHRTGRKRGTALKSELDGLKDGKNRLEELRQV